MNHLTESYPFELIKKAQAGNEDAVTQLLTQYRPMMEHAVSFSFSALRASGWSHEDLMQEAAIALTRAVGAYDAQRGVTFGAYARRCVRNRMTSLVRASRKVNTRVVHKQAQEDVTPTFSLDRERISSLDAVLTAYERKVFALTCDGYKPSEISALLGRERKSVYNALCRIRAKAAQL